MKNIIIRKWQKKDFDNVQIVLRNSWYSTYDFIPKDDLDFYLSQKYSIEELEKLYYSENNICYVSEVDTKICGWLKLTINENKFFLSSIYILPEFQRFKIGSKLFDITIQEALSNSFKEIYVGVMNKNLVALNWYKKLGFEFFREEPFQMGNTKVFHLIGKKKL
ncbi:MAG: GNAT family N-acetyltransferase [Melioribacteraceae bacterium]|nr:GNAT family N-acetyltransferase [Melioribacteraceae bacterium]